MSIDFRYARLGLIAGLACLGSAALAKQTVLPKDSALPAKTSDKDDNHGKTVSEAAKGGKKGTELAELAKKGNGKGSNPPGHNHDSDDDHDHGKGNDGHDHGHGHGHGPRSPH
jgi:hypothetical protein